MTHRSDDLVALGLAAVCGLYAALHACTPVRAAPSRVERSDALARVLACEAWSSQRDHAAILWTLERRRTLPAHRDADITEMAQRYSTCRRGTARARSIVRGEVHLPRAAVDSAWRWQHGRRPADPCGGRAWHWASPELVREPLDCGSTVNAFSGAQ